MVKVKFIHTADLHLDTPFKGLSNWNQELASRLKDAMLQALQNIIDLCIKEKVDFLLISGDVFNSEYKSLAAQLNLIKELKRLAQYHIPVYIIYGNHDPAVSWISSITFPENVYFFNNYENVKYYTYYKNDQPVTDIYGISFKDKAVNINLAHKFEKRKDPAPFSIAMLHGTVGSSGIHDNYAPFKIEDIQNKDFDYWALGHIHKRQIIKNSEPAIVYPGIPQGRDIKENGTGACVMVELEENQDPKITTKPVSIIRFEELVVDISGEEKIDRLMEIIDEELKNIAYYKEDDNYILRVTLKGQTSLHQHLNQNEDIEDLKTFLNEGQLNHDSFRWIDKIYLKTQPDIDIDQIRKGNDFSSEVIKSFESYQQNKEKIEHLIQNMEKELVLPGMNKELKELTTEEKQEIVEKAKWMVFNHLFAGYEK